MAKGGKLLNDGIFVDVEGLRAIPLVRSMSLCVFGIATIRLPEGDVDPD